MDIEIAKCDKKLDLARLNLQKVIKVESQADYAETVPENVRLANEEKVWIPSAGQVLVLIVYLAQNSRSRGVNIRTFKRDVHQTKVIAIVGRRENFGLH